MPATVLVTDYAWPELDIERQVITSAGFQLASGPSRPGSAAEIAALVQAQQPASILTCWAQVDAAAIAASGSLRHVGRIGVGLDNIDLAACSARGVPVTNVPDYCVQEVSDHVLALTVAWARGVVAFDRAVRAGHWAPATAQLRRVADLTVGIVGFGAIGAATARKFMALGCRVLAHTRRPSAQPVAPGSTQFMPQFMPLDALLAESDVVALHLPLTPQTRHLFDAARLARMKRGAFLVNVSRGAIVDSDAVAEALRSGQLSGAGLDVLESEPQVPAALLHEGSLITPHIAFSSGASLAELRRRAAEEAVRVLRGEPPRHPCNRIPSSS